MMDHDQRWIHREAGILISFQWQDSPWNGVLEYTTVLGKLPDVETYIVLCEGTGYDHDTPFSLEKYLAVTKGKDDKITIDDATKDQIAQVEARL